MEYPLGTFQSGIQKRASGYRKAETSFFPDYWSKRQTAKEIESAFENSSPTKGYKGLWKGTSKSGLEIEGYYGKPDGNGATAWPVYEGK